MTDLTLLGITNFRNSQKKFGIKLDDRRRHMYILGKTGMGKSTVQENLIIQDIINGKGLAVIDPHGDLVEKVIQYVPNHRINDVIYFNPSDFDFPIAFNVLESVDPTRRHLVASGLIGIFKKLWADSWGPRLEYLLRNAILSLLDYPNSTILGVVRVLADKEYRKKVVSHVEDPVVKAFWEEEFAKYTDKFASEAIAPIQNKVGQFLSVSMIRNIIGQVKSSFDMRKVMDERKILLMNLSKGRIGEDNSAMLGAMMITKITLAAMSRVDIEEEERADFYLYVDEFQNFATESFADILSEARKYRLGLIMGHQYIAQLDEAVRDAVFGNVGSMICMRVGPTDAEFLEKEFSPPFTQQDLVNLPKWQFYIKLMIDGVSSEPFSSFGLPPMPATLKTDNVETIIRVSRERYTKKREFVEERISKWRATIKISGGKDDDKGNNATCWSCLKGTKIPFEPDGVRAIYCKDCLKLLRDGTIQPISKAPEAIVKEAQEKEKLKAKEEAEKNADKSKNETAEKPENKPTSQSSKEENKSNIIPPKELPSSSKNENTKFKDASSYSKEKVNKRSELSSTRTQLRQEESERKVEDKNVSKGISYKKNTNFGSEKVKDLKTDKLKQDKSIQSNRNGVRKEFQNKREIGSVTTAKQEEEFIVPKIDDGNIIVKKESNKTLSLGDLAIKDEKNSKHHQRKNTNSEKVKRFNSQSKNSFEEQGREFMMRQIRNKQNGHSHSRQRQNSRDHNRPLNKTEAKPSSELKLADAIKKFEIKHNNVKKSAVDDSQNSKIKDKKDDNNDSGNSIVKPGQVIKF